MNINTQEFDIVSRNPYKPDAAFINNAIIPGIEKGRTNLTYNSPTPQDRHFIPGHIYLLGPHEEIALYTFGGTAAVNLLPDRSGVRLTLKSPAPILDITLPDSPQQEFYILLQAQLGRLRAENYQLDVLFTAADPLLLYTAGIAEVYDIVSETGRRPGQKDFELARFVRGEIHNLQSQGLWPQPTPTLQTLFRYGY